MILNSLLAIRFKVNAQQDLLQFLFTQKIHHWLFPSGNPMETQLLLPALTSCEEEMAVMAVMECLGLVDFQTGMGRMEVRE